MLEQLLEECDKQLIENWVYPMEFELEAGRLMAPYSCTTQDFLDDFHSLPEALQAVVVWKRLQKWCNDPWNPELEYQVFTKEADVWSAKVAIDYYVLSRNFAGMVVWFWIGSHADYDNLLAQLR